MNFIPSESEEEEDDSQFGNEESIIFMEISIPSNLFDVPPLTSLNKCKE